MQMKTTMISALRLLRTALGVLLLGIPSAAYSQQPTQPPTQPQPAVVPHVTDTTTPKLVLFITIDAMRSDYLERFEGQLIGGLGRLYRGGALFTNGFQDHAITETAPGHSVTMSGRFPVHTGIIMNVAGVNDTTVKLIDAPGMGASPFRFRGTTLTD